jgi:hypothetical protein
MLNERQVMNVWQGLLAAETRTFYFADLTSRYTRRKQVLTGLSFFLSSGAAASILAKGPAWIPLVQALFIAAATAYSMVMNLDGRIATMAKLHATWSEIATLYDRLWNHAADADAEQHLDAIIEREKAPSELAATSAPNNQALLRKWQDHVFAMYQLHPSA